ncbi:MAG: hypothetical protein IJ735_00565 [Clostridia bacterium]|nr:hypothetical protein [Clostridia bacterium]
MEDQTVKSAETIDNGPKESYGKFRSAEELLKAYNALQSEFTKRSQTLAQYEKEREESDRESKVKDFFHKYPVAEAYADELAQTVEQQNLSPEEALIGVLSKKIRSVEELAGDEKVVEKVLGDPKNRDRVITEYLDNFRIPGISLPKGGAIPLTPPMPIGTVEEAGRVALSILQKQ